MRAMRSVTRAVRAARSLIAKEAQDWRLTDATILDRVRAWRNGFLTPSFLVLDVESFSPRCFLSDFDRLVKSANLNGMPGNLLDNKLVFVWMLRDLGFSANVPKTYAVVLNGAVHPLVDDWQTADGSSIIHALRETEKLVIKPLFGHRGHGVLIVSAAQDEVLVNGEPVSEREFHRCIQSIRQGVVTEFVAQHEYAQRVFAEATNTVRVITMLDDAGPFIAAAIHRFGTSQSSPVDNWSRGGLAATVDLASGELGPVVFRDVAGRRKLSPTHPDTGAVIEGVRIPDWDGIADGIILLAGSVPFAPYVGWDVVVTPHGWSVLEPNVNPGIVAVQSMRPLLLSARVREFYAQYGVISANRLSAVSRIAPADPCSQSSP